MITNIDYLHKVVNSRDNYTLLPRGMGVTFSRCHDVAGLVGLDFEMIFITLTYYRDVDYIIPMLKEILEEQYFDFSRVDRYTIQSHNSTIKFFTEQDQYKMNGCQSERCVMVPMERDD